MQFLQRINKPFSIRHLNKFWLVSFFFIVHLLAGCSLEKQLPKQKPLLAKTEVKGAPEGHQYKLESLINQKPNSRFLGTGRFALWAYLVFKADTTKPDSIREANWFLGKFWNQTKQQIKSGIGEQPVYLDSSRINESARQMSQYLTHQGFFKTEVKTDIAIANNNATVTFEIDAYKPYTVAKIDYYIPDRKIFQLVKRNEKESFIKAGGVYTSQKLAKERDRISELLQNKGFFNFNKQNIYFEVDTSYGNQEVRIGLGVSNPNAYERHTRYKIQDVYIEPDYDFTDTVTNDTIQVDQYHFIVNQDEITIRPQSVLNKVNIKPGQLYSAKKQQQTYNDLAQLAIFKFIDIRYRRMNKDQPDSLKRDGPTPLNCHIQLTTNSQHSVNGEFELSTTEGNEQFGSVSNVNRYFGFSPSISYRNKNFLKRGIGWDLNLRGAYELSNRWFDNRMDQNIFEIGGNTSVNYYGSFLPYFLLGESPAQSVNTSLTYSYLVEGNPNYLRSTHTGQYIWRFENDLNSIYLSPVSVNLVNTNILRQSFRERIESINNPFIESIFDRYTILGSQFTLLYDDEPIQENHHWLIRWELEPTGNLLYLLKDQVIPTFRSNIFNGDVSDKDLSPTFEYGLGNVGFYTYTKTRADFRYYRPGSGENKFVFRFSPGIGVAYGNNEFMPFEKRFFVGGSNSIRAWRVRELGPGSFNDETDELDLRLFRVGDLLMEGNAEYRFNMVSWLNGALFLDFGNVWTLKQESTKPGGQISKDFYKEIALGTGYGFRFDFQVFIFRLDLGLPLRSPLKPEGNRWVAKDATIGWMAEEVHLNIGIGYPF